MQNFLTQRHYHITRSWLTKLLQRDRRQGQDMHNASLQLGKYHGYLCASLTTGRTHADLVPFEVGCRGDMVRVCTWKGMWGAISCIMLLLPAFMNGKPSCRAIINFSLLFTRDDLQAFIVQDMCILHISLPSENRLHTQKTPNIFILFLCLNPSYYYKYSQ